MRRRLTYSLVVLLAPVLALFVSCRRSGSETEAVRLALLYTGNVNGELERCGCAEKQLGGVARRKTVLDQNRSENSILVDSGDIFFGSFTGLVGSRDFYVEKASAMVRSMNRMGYDAATVGDYDFAQGASFLRQRIKEATFPFVCANLIGPDGRTVVAPYQIVQRRNLRVGIVAFLDSSVVSPRYKEALGDWRIEDPFEAAARILPEIQDKSDLIIGLIHFNVLSIKDFLERFPEIQVAVLGHIAGEGKPERVARTVTVSGSDLGKEVGGISLMIAPGLGVVEYEGEVLPVSETVPLDQGVEEEVKRFYDIVRERRFSEDVSFLPSASPGAGYAGAERCLSCHPEFYQRWSITPHAYAFETLEKKGYEFDPECVVCHVVGYRDPAGFLGQDRTPQLKGVQCESCHGPGAGHLRGDPMKSGVDEEVCRTCHNEIRSPAFDFPVYLKRSDQCTLP